jgi:Domain of unknown function (DUF6048)
MKMKYISKYLYSFCFFWVLFLASAQEVKPKTTDTKIIKTKDTLLPKPKTIEKSVAQNPKNDSTVVQKTNRYGLRVGVDLYKLTRGIYDKNYKGIELVGDYRFKKNYYLAAELGTEDKTTIDDRLSSTAKGAYIKVGFDYNVYENWLDMENIISIGLRYGAGTFSQQLNSYKIYNANPYFGDGQEIQSNQKYEGLSASWLEVVGGLKVKVFNNIFVGFNVQLKNVVTNKKPEGFDNLYIPGFNRTYDGSFGVGFSYTVSYFIPIYKKKVEILLPKKEKK